MPLMVPLFTPPSGVPPVEVVFIHPSGLQSRHGRLRGQREATFDVELDREAPSPSSGMRVILNVGGHSPHRVLTTLSSVTGRHLELREKLVIVPEKREYPRVYGAIPLRWRLLRELPEETPWHTPDPLMNFSVSGLKFLSPGGLCQADDLVELELSVGQDAVVWPALARVVRVIAAHPAEIEGGADHQVAVEFLDLPVEARDSLARFTIALQRAVSA